MHMPQLDRPFQRRCSGKQLTTALTDQEIKQRSDSRPASKG